LYAPGEKPQQQTVGVEVKQVGHATGQAAGIAV